MDAGKYEDAISTFEALDGYKDSADKTAECKTSILDREYNNAVTLMNTAKYAEAITAFEKLDGYNDSIEMITECYYQEAIELMNAGNNDEALTIFKSLGDYKNSKNIIEQYCNDVLGEKVWNLINTSNVGDEFTFAKIEAQLPNAGGMIIESKLLYKRPIIAFRASGV